MDAALVLGLHRRYGWKVPGIVAIAGTVPDIDGFSIFGGFSLFERAHRVWGHGLFSACILSFVIGSLDYRFDIITRMSRFFGRHIKDFDAEKFELRDRFTFRGCLSWGGLCLFGCLTHLFGDVIVSGNSEYPDWPVMLFWPFSDRGFVYPLLSWGDLVPSVILFGGALAMLRWRKYTQMTAALSIGILFAYALLF